MAECTRALLQYCLKDLSAIICSRVLPRPVAVGAADRRPERQVRVVHPQRRRWVLQRVQDAVLSHACEKTVAFFEFPYVCPEPVLVK